MKETRQLKLYDVFISHSSKDSKLAIALCHFFETYNLRCWMAPRDITAGKDYAEAIIDAIEASKIMVVVFSDSANNSNHVRNEVERAFNHQLSIIPFKTNDIIPTQSFKYFLSSTHWLDAINGNAEDYFEQLYKNCAALLNKEPGEINRGSTGFKREKSIEVKKVYIAFAALFVIAAIIFFIVFAKGNKNKEALKIQKDSTARNQLPIVPKPDTTGKHNAATLSPLIKPESKGPEHSVSKVPSVDLSSFNGASYSQLSTNYNLTFNTVHRNKLQFSGEMYGYQVHGTLVRLSEMDFKVSAGNVTGNISFVAENKKALGNIVIKESNLPCKVDLTKD